MNRKKGKVAVVKQDSLWKQIWKSKWCYVALLPSIAMLCIFCLYPAISGVFRSFYRWKTKNYFAPVFTGFDNYIKLFQDSEFWSSFLILAVFLVAGFITSFAVNLPITYLIFRMKDSKVGKFFQRAFVIPMMVPTMVVSMYWKFFYQHDTGVLDTILKFIGKEEWIRMWLGDDQITLIAVLLKGFPFAGGFTMLILLAGLLNIDSALEESAQIDGASSWQIFSKIYLPLLIPQIKVLSMLGMILGIQAYDTQIIFTSGRYNTMVPAYYMYKTAFVSGNYGYATTQGVILFIIIMAMTVFQNKVIKDKD